MHLDVNIEELGTELSSILNQTGIENESQYQSDCLDAEESMRWNSTSSSLQPIHRAIHPLLATLEAAAVRRPSAGQRGAESSTTGRQRSGAARH